jgi:hypothetical protein
LTARAGARPSPAAGALTTLGYAAVALGAILGYGSPGVGVVLTAVLTLLSGLPVWVLPVAAIPGAFYAFARTRPWWWLGLLPPVALQVAALATHWRWGRAAIDVFTTLQAGAQHLLQGANPYAFRYQDLVPLPTWHLVSAPFQYGPTALYLGSPGRLVGDVRLLAAAAVVVTAVAVLLVARRSGAEPLQRVAFLVAGTPLFVPLVVNAWVDVYTAAGAALWWLLRDRRWAAASVALGAVAAAKPIMLAALVPVAVWDRAVLRELAVAALAAVLLCLPFAIWTGPAEFVYDVAGVHVAVLNQPWPTSISFDALLLQAHAPTIPDWVAIAVLALSVPAALLWRPPERATRLLAGAALLTGVLLLSRQSFMNYYFGVAVWVLLALAERREPVASLERLPA